MSENEKAIEQYRQLSREIQQAEKRLKTLKGQLEALSDTMTFRNYVEGYGVHGMPEGILFVGTLEECQAWAERNYPNVKVLDKDTRFPDTGRQIGLANHQKLAARIWKLYPTSEEWDKVMALIGDTP